MCPAYTPVLDGEGGLEFLSALLIESGNLSREKAISLPSLPYGKFAIDFVISLKNVWL